MSPQEIEKLLGGYATDTLTEEERRTLFTAALGNQALFDALADEQALRELLQDAPSRAQLLAALRQEHVSPLARLSAWLRRPSVLALAAAVTAGIVTVAVVIPRKTAMERPATVAMSRPPEPLPAPETKTAPEAVPAPKPAPPVPAGSPSKDTVLRRQEPERDATTTRNDRDAIVPQNAPPARNTVATIPPPPAPQSAAVPAPPVVVSPAQSQFRAAEELQVQAAAPKLADAKSPTAAPGAAPQEARKKESAAAGARELYYATQTSAVSGFVSQPKTAKAKQDFGRAMTMRGGAGAPAAPAVFAVRYSILKRNPDGSFAEVDPSTIFAPGDALRVRFETNQAGNLGVMERHAGGPWTLRMGARTQPGEPIYMPAESTLNIGAAGGYRFFVRFSRSLRSEPNLDQIAQSPNLLRETAANSVYVANPIAATDPAVDFELAINAK